MTGPVVQWLDLREPGQPIRVGHTDEHDVRIRLTPEAAEALARLLIRAEVTDAPDDELGAWAHTGIDLLAAAAHATTVPPPPVLAPVYRRVS